MPHTRVSSHAQASTSHYSQTAGLPTVSLNQRCRSYSLQHQQEARTLQTIASAPSAFSPLERFQAATQRCVAKIGAVSLAAVIGLSSCGTPVQASIPTTELIRGPDLEASGQMGSSRVLPNSAVGTGFLPRSAVVQQKGRAPVIGDKQRAEMAIGLLQDAREGSDAGNYIKVWLSDKRIRAPGSLKGF